MDYDKALGIYDRLISSFSDIERKKEAIHFF